MGLFGKLFEKKECCICGGEIGLLGNRKLEDGNLCKKCAAKLSPWFEDRRHSTTEQIREQLDYREANKEKVAAFRITRTIGKHTKVLLDEDAGVFMVTSARNPKEENPDVLRFTDVTGCNLDVEESWHEKQYRDNEGNMVSYNPPQYTDEYDFYVVIQVRNPYFDEMRFKLNTFSVEVERGRMHSNPKNDPDYRYYQEMGMEIKEALMSVRQQARNAAAAAAAPKAAVNCPYCGATTIPNASGCCEFCGGAVNA